MKTSILLLRIREIIKMARLSDYRGDYEVSEDKLTDLIIKLIEDSNL